MKTYIIQLENHDDVISTRDKMGWSKAPRILLIWPRRGQVLNRQVDLLVLQRRASELGAQLGIVSRQEDVAANAQDLGIPVFSSAIKAQRGSWRKPRGWMRRSNWRRWKRESVTAEELRLRRIEFSPAVEGPIWLRVSAFVLGWLAVVTLVFFFLPSAEVKLSPALREQQLSLDVWASPQISVANPSGGLPAGEITVVVEGSEQIPSTGSASLPVRTADGLVVFSNLTDIAVEIPAETVVVTLTNPALRFSTTRAVTVPAGSGRTVDAPVRSLTPGSAGNVEAGVVEALEGIIGLSVTVTNPQPIGGGSDQIGPAPLARDYETLREMLFAKLDADAMDELSRQLSDGDQLLAQTVKVNRVLQAVREPEPGQPGDFAQLRMRIEYTGWYFSSADLEQIVQTALAADNPAQYLPVEGSLIIEPISDPVLDENSFARWKVKVTRTLRADWSDERIAQGLVGRSQQDAASWLAGSLELAEAPLVQLFPKWWQRMPFLAFRIGVVKQ